MPKSFFDYLNVKDPNLLKEYGGKSLYDSGTNTYWDVTPTGLVKNPNDSEWWRKNGQPLWQANAVYSPDENGGLQPMRKGSYMTSEAFRYFGQAPAEQIVSNFGMGATIPQDKYTGETAGFSSGGATLYKLSDGSVTATPPAGTAKPAFQEPDPIFNITAVKDQPITTGTKYYKDGKEFNPALYTNLQPGTVDFENYLKEQKITTKAPESTTAVDLTKTPETNAIDKSAEMNSILGKVKDSYKNAGGSALANSAFIQAVAQAKYGRAASVNELKTVSQGGMVGASLDNVLTAFGLADKMGVLATEDTIKWKPGLSDLQKESIRNLIQNKPRDKWNQKDVDNYNFATGGSEKVTTPTGGSTGTGADVPPADDIKTTDPVTNQDIIDIEKFGEKLDADLAAAQAIETAAATELADFQKQYGLGQNKIAGKDIPLSLKAGQGASFAQQNSIIEKNLIAKLGIAQNAEAGIIDRANLQAKIDDAIYSRKRDVIKDAQTYRQDQQEALATIINLFPNGIDKISPAIMTMITNAAKDTGIDAGLITRALESKRLDYDKEQLAKKASNVDFKQIGTDEDGNPTYGFVDTDNKKVTPVNTVESSTSAYFTDHSSEPGIKWNIAGWAKDDIAKAASMQRTSDQIGKLTDENLVAKVKQFAPGLTADMIKSTSANTGVSWEALLTMVTQEATVNGQMSPVANKNNNFGGLTFNNQDWIKMFGGEMGTARPAAEGGNYIKFPTKQAGFDAMGALMASYGKVTGTPVNDIIRKTAENYVKIEAKISDIKGKDAKETAAIIKEYLDIKANSGTISRGDALITAGLQSQKLEIENLIKTGSYKKVVGTFPLGRMPVWSRLTGEAQDAIGTIRQMVAKETLDTLINLKKSGGTLGALSNEERLMLQNAATKIGGWEVLDKNGIGTGRWDASEPSFEKELTRLKDLTELAINNATGGTGIVNSLEQNLAANPGKVDEYNTIVADNPNLTDDEINQVLGFN